MQKTSNASNRKPTTLNIILLIRACGSKWLTKPKYNTVEMYKRLLDPGEQSNWWKAIWKQYNVPKFSFVA